MTVFIYLPAYNYCLAYYLDASVVVYHVFAWFNVSC